MIIILVCLGIAAFCGAACFVMCRNTRKACAAVFERADELAQKQFQEIRSRMDALENGVVPDFEQAKEAAKAVNDFNKGLSAIMGYDPFEARRKAQEEGRSKA